MFFSDFRNIIIVLGAFCELLGGFLLASEMIGLLDRLKKWNLQIQNKIQSKKEKLETDSWKKVFPIILILYVLKYVQKEISLKTAISIVFLSILLFINYIIRKLLYYSGLLSEKLNIKQILGVAGVIFLCIGFIFQLYINLTTQ